MHFFSRYYYIWSFSSEKERAFDQFVKRSNLLSLRLIAFITIFGMSLFLMIDLSRDIEYYIIFIARSLALFTAAIIMAVTFKKDISTASIQRGVAAITLISLSVSFVTSTLTSLPGYYLTNLVFLIFVLVVTASGLKFRHGLFLNLTCLVLFLVYSQWVRKDPFYITQYPHIFSILIYIQIVGFALESRRRSNYLQFLDLTEQKRIVDELNQQKNKVISVLSHDVASPLSSLSNILYLQSKGKLEQAELNSFLKQVGEQLGDFTELLYGLVRWCRSQMDGFTTQKKPVDIISLVDEIVRLFRPMASQKNLTISFRADQYPIAFADEDMIKVAIRNLTSNAIKFATPGTEVAIGCRPKDSNFIEIKVTNNGSPFPTGFRNKVFTYEMTSTQGTANENGMGLGLAMTAFFVRFNDGEIYLDTEADSNLVTFRVELPLAAVESRN